jgi:multidrug efflux pump subunit AcrA (membrane-fusion protein)
MEGAAHNNQGGKAMKRIAALGIIAVLAVTGCDREHDGHSHDEATAHADEIKLFEKGKGLRLPDEMQQSLGVKTVEITEKQIDRSIQRPAKVFRGAGESEPAQALMWFSEADAAVVKAGQPVSLRLSGGDTFTGTIARVEQRLTNVLGQSEAVIEFADPNRRAVAGALLTARIVATNTNAVAAVPESAVIRGVETTFVYTVSGSHYVRTPVKLGAEADGWVEVVDGLYTGDMVVVRAADALWNIELCALKGGTPCCPVPKSRRDDD